MRPMRMAPCMVGVLVVVGVSMAGTLTACDQGRPSVAALATAPTRTASAAAASLPHLSPEAGWHVVAQLGTGDGNVQNSGGSFVADRPYKILFACMGSGSLTLSYADASQTLYCGAVPELHGANGSPAPQVTVQVGATGAITWEALVEMQD